jgi:hypothetical protein
LGTRSNVTEIVNVAGGAWTPSAIAEPRAGDPALGEPSVAGAALATAALAAPILALIALGAARMGTTLRPSLLVVWGAGAVVARVLPAARTGVAILAGGVALAIVDPLFSLYFGAMVCGLAASRRRALPFAALLAAAAVVWPKLTFARHFHEPAAWGWIRQPSLALALFASGAWFRTRADARQAGAPPPDDAATFLLLYLFPSHVTHPMVFGPALLRRPGRIDARAIARLAFWFTVKVAALVGLRQLGPQAFLRALGGPEAAALAWPALWKTVAVSYVETYLALATYADIPVLVGRLYGFDLAAPFRAPLLAANPVDLWRRWGLYTRRLLLDLVFIPLGGSKRHKYRNVGITFLASALVFHTGWLGSIYWQVGRAGWRDQTLYFGAQALAVCAAMVYWDLTGRRPAHIDDVWSIGAWSWRRAGGVIATQAYSALAHVIVLAQGMDLGDRFRLIGRCLGL